MRFALRKRTVRKAIRFIDVVAVVLIVWAIAAAMPLSWFWFHPKALVIANSEGIAAPKVELGRDIYRRTLMNYHVVVVRLGPDKGRRQIVCDSTSAPFWYSPARSVPADADLEWLVGSSWPCWPLDPGDYIVETCWTASSLFLGTVPPKTACLTSNVFTVRAVTQKQAQETVEQTETLRKQLESLSEQVETLQMEQMQLQTDERVQDD